MTQTHVRGPAADPLSFLFSALAIRLIVWWARWSQDAQQHRLDPRGPRELLGTHRGNLRIEPDEVAESRLVCLELSAGSWAVTRRRRRALRFRIEDGASLKTALEHLPRLLGPALDVSVSKDIASKSAVPMMTSSAERAGGRGRVPHGSAFGPETSVPGSRLEDSPRLP